MKPYCTITQKSARRLAISAQCLDAPVPKPTKDALLNLLQQIRCVQMDPIRAVERTQYLVLWSRLGNFDRNHFHQLIYEDKELFEYWAHAASFVLTEDYPLHEMMMRNYGKSGSAWSKRLAAWVEANDGFRNYVLDEIRSRGPLLTQEFDDKSKVPWASSGWTSGRSVSYMIDYLWSSGALMVARRDGLKRWWDLTERVLPEEAREGGWSASEVTADAVQKSLKALGVAQIKHISHHFTEGRYPEMSAIFPTLLNAGTVLPVAVKGWQGEWFIHADSLPLLERIEAGEWKARTALLSPFDGLIRDRERTELMWDFYYRIEIYVPKAKREFGYYVLPILYGDKLVGRIDSNMDRKKHIYTIQNVYWEDGIRMSKALARSVKREVEKLGRFLDAEDVVYADGVESHL